MSPSTRQKMSRQLLAGYVFAFFIGLSASAAPFPQNPASCASGLTHQSPIPLTGMSTAMQRFSRQILGALVDEKGGNLLQKGRFKPGAMPAKSHVAYNLVDANYLLLYTPRGEYHIRFNRNVTGEPGLSVARNSFLPGNPGDLVRYKGEIYLHPEWLHPARYTQDAEPHHRLNLEGFARSMFIGDEYIHPHLSSPWDTERESDFQRTGTSAAQYRLSQIQKDVAEPLAAGYRAHQKPLNSAKGPYSAAIILPGGNGKTVILAHHIRETMMNERGDPPLVVLTVNDTDLLNNLASRVANMLGFTGDQVVRKYNHREADGTLAPITANTRLVIVTRPTLLSHQADFQRAARGRRVLYAFDEAHHTGAEATDPSAPNGDGQYRTYLRNLKATLTQRDQILFLSATFFHDDMDVRVHADNNIFTAFLSDAERREFITTNSIPRTETLTWWQLFRSIRRGYQPPIGSLVHTTLDNSVLDNPLETDARSGGTTYQLVPNNLVSKIAENLWESRMERHQQGNRNTQRAWVFLSGTERLNFLRDELRTRLVPSLGDDHTNDIFQVMAYHTGKDSDDNVAGQSIPDWFANPNAPIGLSLVALLDQRMGEGVDIQDSDEVHLAKKYGRTVNGRVVGNSRLVYQNGTRAARAAKGKISWRVYTYGASYMTSEQFHEMYAGALPQAEPAADPNIGIDPEGPDVDAPKTPRSPSRGTGEQVALGVDDKSTPSRTDIGPMPVQAVPGTDSAPAIADPEEVLPEPPAPAVTAEVPFASRPYPEPTTSRDLESAYTILVQRYPTAAEPFKSNPGLFLKDRVRRILNTLEPVRVAGESAKVQAGAPRQIMELYGTMLGRALRVADIAKELGTNPKSRAALDSELAQLNDLLTQDWFLMRRLLLDQPDPTKERSDVVVVKIARTTGSSRDFSSSLVILKDAYQSYARLRKWQFGEIAQAKPDPRIVEFRVTGPGALAFFNGEIGQHTVKYVDNGRNHRNNYAITVADTLARDKSAKSSALDTSTWEFTHLKLKLNRPVNNFAVKLATSDAVSAQEMDIVARARRYAGEESLIELLLPHLASQTPRELGRNLGKTP